MLPLWPLLQKIDRVISTWGRHHRWICLLISSADKRERTSSSSVTQVGQVVLDSQRAGILPGLLHTLTAHAHERCRWAVGWREAECSFIVLQETPSFPTFRSCKVSECGRGRVCLFSKLIMRNSWICFWQGLKCSSSQYIDTFPESIFASSWTVSHPNSKKTLLALWVTPVIENNFILKNKTTSLKTLLVLCVLWWWCR